MSDTPLASEAPPSSRRDLALTLAVLVAVAVPLVATTVRNIANGWLPIGDNAYFTVRSRDVFTEHNPLLGAWSSGSAAVGTFVNNLGPLQFQLLAPFTKIGPAAGTIVGVMFTNVAAIAGIAYISRRLAGLTGLAITMAATASVTWTMGSQMLIESRQHSAMMLPFLCYVVGVWALTSGASWALWITVLAGSLTIQTHLSYALLVPVLAAPAVVGVVVAGRRQGWRPDRLRHVIVAAVVALVCWIHPLWDQFFGNHNMTKVLSTSGDGEAPGLVDGGRLIARVLSLPPWWGRNSYSEYDPQASLPNTSAAWVSLLVLVALIAAASAAGRRAGSRLAVAGTITALVALVGALGTAAMLPSGGFGLAVGNYRWLWPLGAFCLIALLFAAVTTASARTRTRRPYHIATVAATAIAILFGALNVPYSYQASTERAYWPSIDVTRRLTSQLDDAGIEGPVLIDRTNGFFGEPYTFATLVELQSLGIEFDFTTRNEIYRWGDGRRAEDDAVLMTFAYRDDARRVPTGTTRVAFADGLQTGEARELQRIEPRIIPLLRSDTLEVDLSAAKAETGKDFDVFQDIRNGVDVDPASLIFDIQNLRAGGWVRASTADLELLDRWQALREARLNAVAIYITPLDVGT